MIKIKKLSKTLLNMMNNDNFNKRIIVTIKDKNIINKIKPKKPNLVERNKYITNIISINKNNHINLKKFIKKYNGTDIRCMDFLNLISCNGNKELVINLSKRDDVLKIDIEDYITLPEEELYGISNKKQINSIVKNNYENLWNLKKINKIVDKNLQIEYLTKVNNDVLVSLLDTGIDVNHKELKGIIDLEKSVSFIKNEKSIIDYNGHGTHIAGIIGGKNVGICEDIKIMSIKCFNKKGLGSTCNLIQGLEYSIVNGANIIQLFLDNNIDLDYKNCLGLALKKSLDIGIHICLSIEKSLNNIYKKIKTCGIIDRSDENCKYYCPGIGIPSSYINNQYRYLNGISMSTAHLTGLIANILQINQNIYPWNIQIVTDDNNIIDVTNSCYIN
jgi:subtilisin